MSDTTVNQFLSQADDAAARTGFVPSPPTPAADLPNGYLCYQRDTATLWAWDSDAMAWVQVGGSGAAGLFSTQITIADVDIKALPTTPYELVAAPGANQMIVPVSMVLMFAAGGTGYTNINTTISWIYATVGAIGTSTIGNDSSLGTPLSDLTNLLGSADRIGTLIWPFRNDRGSANQWGIMTFTDALSNVTNEPLTLSIDNNGSGNLTGGNAGNVFVVDVTYRIVSTP